ncbi:Rhodanese-like domain protein [Aspergillus parasiticus SU-1]|uniref:Rhodanese-like domain protein n=1 Tax=Aspergillus parasiticus (strain ATCC 56775 / NRRL 5862 / SRRC 143 / SU-1) TaxID=1403190 RepID=A0A0F0IHK0_ASPPU|nr:Rhodanese-like domain protein [Aspergillus parasiticus SU-1]
MEEMGIQPDDILVVYDAVEIGMYSAPRVAWACRLFGHDSVHVLNNFRLYAQQGYPIEEGNMSPLPQTVYPVHEPGANQVIAFEELRNIILHERKNYHIIDARIPGRFSGTQEEADPTLRSGHMPSAINIPLAAMLDTESKAFLPLPELKRLFETAGIDGTRPVILTCNSGVTAAALDLSLQETSYDMERRVPLFSVPTDTYLKPAILREGHDIGIRFTDLGYSHLVPHKYTRVDELDLKRLNLKILQLEFGIPTAMNELQERIFTDFLFRWNRYLDPSDWGYTNRDFKSLSMALLRLTAWDFEVTSGTRTHMGKAILEQWQYPKTEVFWFHGFLVVIQEDIRPVSMKSIAILKARIYLDHNGTNGHVPRLILLSPTHVAFVELGKDGDWCSNSLLLVTSSSAAWCSPGFRALSRVLSSNYQTPIGDTAAQFEKWRVALPFEILHMILKLCEPRHAVSFAQASVAVEKCCYTSIPQFKDLAVREYVLPIPCCASRLRRSATLAA